MVGGARSIFGIKLQNSPKFLKKAKANFIENLNWIITDFIFGSERLYKRMREFLSELPSIFNKNPRFVDVLLSNSA